MVIVGGLPILSDRLDQALEEVTKDNTPSPKGSNLIEAIKEKIKAINARNHQYEEIINMKNHEKHSSRLEVLLEELINEVIVQQEDLNNRMNNSSESLTNTEAVALATKLISDIKRFNRLRSILEDAKSMFFIKE